MERLAPALALVFAAVMLLAGLGRSGIWDPYELDSAELARRTAVNAFGAASLSLPHAQNGLPTLTDLGMGELPFTSMALGFRLFGLADWSGRLPLALWVLAGALALGHLLARLVGPKAGLYGVVAFVTMPLVLVQARTMLGDAVTLAAVTIALVGLTGALLDSSTTSARSPWQRLAWLALGLFGLVAGFLSRGLLLGVALPCLGVGLGWLVLRFGGEGRGRSPGAALFGAGVLLVGLVALGRGLWLLHTTAASAPLDRELGFALLVKPTLESTFDLPLRELGHALFPWSAFLPFAVGRVFRGERGERDAPADEAATRVRDLAGILLVTAIVAVGLAAYLGPYAGALPFAAPAALAGLVALALVAHERDGLPSRALVLGTLLFGAVLYTDMTRLPDKAFAPFAIADATFPKSFEPSSQKLMLAVLGVFALGVLAWLDEAPDELVRGDLVGLVRRRVDEHRAAFATLAETWGGNLLFSLVVIEAALVGLGAMVFFGKRLGWEAVDKLPKNFADTSVNLWWMVPIAAALVLPLSTLARDLVSLVTTRLLPTRASLAALALVGTGALQGFVYYPSLADQVSPKEVFDTYAKLGAGKPLGLLGVQSRSGAYYDAPQVESFSDAVRALDWLVQGEGERRFLVLRAEDLPRLNSLHRRKKGVNLPIVDGRSSQILLASSDLDGAASQNPLDALVMNEPPAIDVPQQAMFEDELEALGWELHDADDVWPKSLVPGTPYRMRFFYRVKKPVTGTWKSFIHIDGYGRRHNGDHPVTDGRYPTSLWLPGDVVVDEYTLVLESNFTPGDYTMFYGFFQGERRYEVTSGPTQENRIIGGILPVR
jgi:4-amino-4-deoxy-L-arabinose transferase-like glycosyltransferase